MSFDGHPNEYGHRVIAGVIEAHFRASTPESAEIPVEHDLLHLR
jgi:hypothetical protein